MSSREHRNLFGAFKKGTFEIAKLILLQVMISAQKKALGRKKKTSKCFPHY